VEEIEDEAHDKGPERRAAGKYGEEITVQLGESPQAEIACCEKAHHVDLAAECEAERRDSDE
jgi:hypothetical protein